MRKSLYLFMIFVLMLKMPNAFCENNEMQSSYNNYLLNCDFEAEGDFKYGNGNYSDKIVGIEGSSVEAIWPQHSYILGYAPESFSGNRALHIKSNYMYYPTAFKAELERGSVYKFSAWVKLAPDAKSAKANLAATTRASEWSYKEDILISEPEHLNDKYSGENIFGDFNKYFVEFSKDEWKKIERMVYAAPSETSETVKVWLGLPSYGKEFNYYIDDVQLVKQEKKIVINDGYEKVYAVCGEDKIYTYSAECAFCTSDEIKWSISGENQIGVSIDDNGNLTVSDNASGYIVITAEGYINDGSGEKLKQSKVVQIIDEFTPDISINIDSEKFDKFSPENELYNLSYYSSQRPETEVSGDYEINIDRKNDIDIIEINNGGRKKYYEVFFDKRTYSDNLYKYGSFENGVIDDMQITSPDVNCTLKTEANESHGGEYSAHVKLKRYGRTGMKTDVECGKMYLVSMWVKKCGQSENNRIFPCFYLDSDSAEVKYYHEQDKCFYSGEIFKDSNSQKCTAINEEWQKIDRIIKIDGNTDKPLQMIFGPANYSTEIEFLIDDVFVYELELTENNGVYFGAVCKDSNGSLVNDIKNAENVEIYVYNPNLISVELMTSIAGYKQEKLIGAVLKNETVNSTADVIRYKLKEGLEADEYKTFVWNSKLEPYIDSLRLK